MEQCARRVNPGEPSGQAALKPAIVRLVALIAVVLCTSFAPEQCGLISRADAENADELSTADKDERVYNIVKQAQPLITERKFVEARKLLKEGALLDPTPNSGNLHASLAFVAHQLGDPEGAIAESQLAMKFDPRFVDELTWNVAMAYKDLGEYGTAREWLQKYLDTNPVDPKRKRDAEEFFRKLGEQESSNGSQSIKGPDYLDSLIRQHGVGRWARSSFPLKVFIEKSENVPGVPADSVQMLEDCFSAWNTASGGLLPIQQVAKAKQADIVIQWTNIPSKVSAHDGVHLEQGITRVMAYQSPGSPINTIRSATIILLTVSRDTAQPLQADEMKAVCLHEIGHAFGLGGHSANSADTMYFSSSARQLPALSHRDKTTISRLYTASSTAQGTFGLNTARATMPPFSQPQDSRGFSQIGFPQRNPYQQRNMQNGWSYPQQQQQQPFPQQPYAQPGYPQQQSFPQQPYAQPGYPQQQPFPQQPYTQSAYPPQYPPQYSPQSYPPQSAPLQSAPLQPFQQPYAQPSYPPQPFPQQQYPPQSYPQQAYPQQSNQQLNKQPVPFPQAAN